MALYAYSNQQCKNIISESIHGFSWICPLKPFKNFNILSVAQKRVHRKIFWAQWIKKLIKNIYWFYVLVKDLNNICALIVVLNIDVLFLVVPVPCFLLTLSCSVHLSLICFFDWFLHYSFLFIQKTVFVFSIVYFWFIHVFLPKKLKKKFIAIVNHSNYIILLLKKQLYLI